MIIPSAPRAGDVLFVNSTGFQTRLSRFAQTLLDPDAATTPHTFSHVAIAMTNLLALEAVPYDPDGMMNRSAVLDGTVEIGEWTGSELRSGVRLIPIADLVIPAMRNGTDFIVLRSADADEERISSVTPLHVYVLRSLGSGYSLEVLHRRAEASLVARTLRPFVGSKIDWTSVPADLATLVDLDPELRKRIEVSLPSYSLHEEARTYFCSQLVVRCLREFGLAPPTIGSELTTPSGLFRLLGDLKWLDVSSFYRCAPDATRYLQMTPSGHSASYTSMLALTLLSRDQQATGMALDFLEASMDAMTQRCDEIIKRNLKPSAADTDALETLARPGNGDFVWSRKD